MADKSGDPRRHRVPPPGAQVGRRPPQPMVPIVSGVMWIVVGIVVLVSFHAGFKFVIGIFAIGVGLLFLRGGLTAAARQQQRRDGTKG
jgi:hypothetical protein